MLSEKRVVEMLALANNIPIGFAYDSVVYALRAVLKIILELDSEEEVAWFESWCANSIEIKKENKIEEKAEEGDIK